MTEIERLAKELVDKVESGNYERGMVLSEYTALKYALHPKPKKPTRQEIIDDLKTFLDWWGSPPENQLTHDCDGFDKTLENAIKELEKPVLEWVDYDPDVVPDCKWALRQDDKGDYSLVKVTISQWLPMRVGHYSGDNIYYTKYAIIG